MTLLIEVEQEADGRWLAEVASLPGVMTYGHTRTDAVAKIQAPFGFWRRSWSTEKRYRSC